jgi:hypothetical protein
VKRKEKRSRLRIRRKRRQRLEEDGENIRGNMTGEREEKNKKKDTEG